MKRFLSLILTLLTLLPLLLTTPANAAAPAKITAATTTASPGDTNVTVTISLSDNPGICGMILHISYDKRLTLTNIEKCTALSSLTLAPFAKPYINPINASWDGVSADSSNGDLLKLTFDVAPDAEAGVYNINISYNTGDVFDNDLNDLALDVTSGYITVESTSIHTHTLSHAAAKEADCTSAGQVEHWICATCGKTFADETAENELARVDIPKDKSNHIGGTEIRNEKDATDTRDGYTGDKYCKGCGRKIKSGKKIPKTRDPETTPAETAPEPTETAPASEPAWTNPFIDVNESDSYYSAVEFVYKNNLFKGVSDTRFAPDTTMTRAMFVTVLGRLAGVDAASFTETSFDDVTAGEWYAPYVEWAAKYDIVKGYGDGKFGVNNTITVEQAAVIMARYAEYTGMSITSATPLTGYRDSSLVSEWAAEQMKWAVEKGVYTGDGISLNPQSPAKRSLVAEIIYSFINITK